MKRFLRNISLFSLLIVIPLVAAEIYVRQMPNPSRATHQWMLELFVGTAHPELSLRLVSADSLPYAATENGDIALQLHFVV